MKRKTLLPLISSLLALGLVGCGEEPSSDGNNENPSSSSQTRIESSDLNSSSSHEVELKDNEISFKEGTIFSKSYDGTPFSFSIDDVILKGNGNVTFTYKVKDSSDEAYAEEAPKRVGNYTVKASVEETNEYKAIEITKDFSITAKKITSLDSLEFLYSKSDCFTINNKEGALSKYGILDGDEVELNFYFDSSNVGQTLNNIDFVDIGGKDANQYDFKNVNVDAKIIARVLSLPATLSFSRNASEKRVDGVYKFGLDDGLILGEDEVWLINKNSSIDIENPGTYTLHGSDLEISNPNYKVNLKDDDIITINVVDDEEFYMSINEIFSISGKGIVFSGVINRGTIHKNDVLEIVDLGKEVTVVSIESFRKELDSAAKGTEIGILTDLTSKDDISRGMILAKKNTLKNYSHLKMDFHFFSQEEGGDRKAPIMNGYNPNFHFYKYKESNQYKYAKSLAGKIVISDSTAIAPGEDASITVYLNEDIPLDLGMEVLIKEGSNKVVGKGVITSLEDHDSSFEAYGLCNTCGKFRGETIDTFATENRILIDIPLEKGKVNYYKVITTSTDSSGKKPYFVYNEDELEVTVYDLSGNIINLAEYDEFPGGTHFIKAKCKVDASKEGDYTQILISADIA